ncbi:sugar ABC transporter ATP-binding protein [Faecalicatena contorta]|uniref:Monosaccharide ABC transporter ATP-binding protein, CUT2 family n=1 Tax=Faecalicatena contorta TaxID=39482 RepID=A0A316A2V5_9FIRM|nr:sugar ABC transporter ATP-binding protein [Faecalicatena contorta]PWJ51923.1 monosaccharide ABC transporter ATP-binding protein (CUT2 family) [Faecalicatena contorta]SUQ12201.1 monosaccharide ABC transporter ATP-binding protein, CUT2 family [Faecalicatena contorta]
MEKDVILEAEHINKNFGKTCALKDASISIKRGSIHSLVGKNGAGKSTIVNIIAGVYRQTSGDITFEGMSIGHLSFKERQDMGIRLVTQHASVVLDLDVAENIFLGLWPKNKARLVDRRLMHENAQKILDEYGLKVDPYELVRRLTPVEQRKLNIIRAMFGGGKLIILDEPTTSLSIEDRNNLFRFVRHHAEHGVAFILISHYLEEILQVSSEITVLRDGRVYSGNMEQGSTSDKEMELAKLIAGEDVELTYRNKDKKVSEEVVVKCEGISAKFLESTDFQIHRGEIVGFVGFSGSGARELCLALYGMIKKKSGKVTVCGKETDIKNPTDALKYKICLVPNDRHAEGIVPIMSVKENIGFSCLRTSLLGRFGLLDRRKETTLAEDFVKRLAIKTQSIYATSGSLSGGNQQKVVLAKVLAVNSTLLILDEPTIGIDIKSREEIMGLIKELTNEGMSVIYLTNDFEELLRIVDRVVIFSEGKIVGNMKNENLTSDMIVNIRDRRTL